MDWNKINFDEVGYCFKSTKSSIDFACIPTQTDQIRKIIAVFFYYGIKNFTEDDVQQIFEKIQVISPRNGKMILPTIKKIQNILEKMVVTEEIDINDAQFYIPDSYRKQCEIIEMELQRGKEQGYLEGWIEYAKKNQR